MAPDTLDAAARLLTYGVGGGIFLNSLDELHIDANYFLRRVGSKTDAATPRDTTRAAARARKSIAILVPAWRESDVLEQMLEHNLAAIEYDHARYDIFVGTYPNDPETQARVDAVAHRAPNVHKVVLPHDGPTSKGDCLNWVFQAIVHEEQRRGQRFDILLMHDAEDVIHPASLRLYDSLIPPNDFVQTPVFSLPLSPGRFTAATYIDEFAEHHLRDMPVREAMGGLVPSAGVGSAFARDAFDAVALANGPCPFDTESLTEDSPGSASTSRASASSATA
jgi:adsorption protein B